MTASRSVRARAWSLTATTRASNTRMFDGSSFDALSSLRSALWASLMAPLAERRARVSPDASAPILTVRPLYVWPMLPP